MTFDPNTAVPLAGYPGASTSLSNDMDAIDKAGGVVDIKIGPDGKIIKPKFDPTTAKIFDPSSAKPISSDPLEQIQPSFKGPAKTELTLLDKWKGANETISSLLTSVPASVVGPLAGLFHSLTSGKFGTPEGVSEGAKRAAEVTESLTYKPRTTTGQENLATISEALDASKIAGLNPATVLPGVKPGALRATAGAIEEALPDTAAIAKMPGIGAAEVPAATLRRERAASLPIPIDDLTKGQAERTFEQQKFERETAKTKIGEPLRERFAEHNNKVLQNFYEMVDMTGAEAPSLRASGSIVNQALIDKVDKAKGKINQAYQAARDAGELAAPVPTNALVDYINTTRPESINAPVLTTIEKKLVQMGGAVLEDGVLRPGRLPLNDMEELRKMIGRVSGSTDTNIKFGGEAKGIIDSMTENSGGDLYSRARLLRTQYAKEFKEKSVINQLVSFKPGTTDRMVALEDVFGHSILNGSLDDVRAVRKTLQTAGTNGEQAWKELQGQTVNYLKDQATKNVNRDIHGNPIVSPSGLDKAVVSLDKDGKLDFIFGKKGAEQIRDLNDIAKDIFTSPPGTINYSNTSSALMEALGNAAVGKLPTAAAKVIGLTKNAIETRKLRAQVGEALAVPGEPEQLRRKQLGY